MAHPETEAHIDAQARLRAVVSSAIASMWRGLGNYDEPNVAPFVGAAVPLVAAGQRQSVLLTNAYLARFMGRDPLPINVSALSGAALRAGADPREVYRRPFVTVWTALKAGTEWADAVSAGLERATATAEMDVQMASRATYAQAQEMDEAIYGYARAADAGACQFCAEVDGAYIKSADAMPLHNRCGCGLEPLTAPHPRAAKLPSGVAVHEHGELGPVLGSPDHNFTTQGQIN